MKMLCRALVVSCLLLSAASAQAATPPPEREQPQRVSRFGEYKGYSQPVYDGWERTSFHIPARGPEGEALLRAAVAEQRANCSMAEITRGLPLRELSRFLKSTVWPRT